MSMIRSRWAAIGAAVAVSLGAGAGFGLVNATVDSGERPVYVPINPCRLMDTRAGSNNVGPRSSPLGADETITVQAHGSNGECTGPSAIPADAVGLVMNVTALKATGRSFLTFWGSGANPGTANLNPDPGEPPTPNSVSTPLSSSGSFELYNAAATVEVVIDVNGYYVDHNHDDRYDTTAEVDAKIAAVEAEVAAVGSGRRFGRQIMSVSQVASNTMINDLAVGANGLVVVSGRSTTDFTTIGCLTQGCTIPASYELDVATSGTWSSITNGADGQPIISYERSGTDELMFADCDNPLCSSAQLNPLDSTIDVGETSMAVRPSGNPLIAVWEDNDNDVKMIACTNPTCSSVPTRTVVDSAGTVGRGLSLAIGTDGLGTMAYSASGLRVARCSNDACTAITHNNVDTVNIFDASLAIGVDGNPVISYSDNDNAELRLAVCGDPACASATITTLDGPDAPFDLVGRSSSIAIDSAGNPVVAYDASAPGLASETRLVRCDDSTCSSWTVSVIDDDEAVTKAVAVMPDGSLVVGFTRRNGSAGVSNDSVHLAFVSPASHTPNQLHP